MVVIDHNDRTHCNSRRIGRDDTKKLNETFKTSNKALFPSNCTHDDAFLGILEVANFGYSQG